MILKSRNTGSFLSTAIYLLCYHINQSNAQIMDTSLLNLIFPNGTLEEAWENFPLHVVNRSEDTNNDESNNFNECLFLEENECPEERLRKIISPTFNSFANIISINDIDAIFKNSEEQLVHGHHGDFSLVKKVTRGGEDWNGSLPSEKLNLQEIHNWFDKGGFTLIINHMEKRWQSIKSIASQLLSETMCRSVSCNLYMTPADGKYGFEQHFDWMDVIVLQISGKKQWTVANKPLVYLTTPDLKYKPSPSYLNEYMSPGNYSTFMLQPGDVLYIPRGFVHNASTTKTLVGGEPSLHLTFGIEHGCDTIVESLLHHALYLYDKNANITAAANTKLIIALMHFAISEVSRNACNNEGMNTFDVDVNACVLRKSISIYAGNASFRNMKSEDEHNFKTALEAFFQLAEPSRAFQFFELIMEGQTSLSGPELGQFCLPSSLLDNKIDIDILDNANYKISSEEFSKVLIQFYNFGITRYTEVSDLLFKEPETGSNRS